MLHSCDEGPQSVYTSIEAFKLVLPITELRLAMPLTSARIAMRTY